MPSSLASFLTLLSVLLFLLLQHGGDTCDQALNFAVAQFAFLDADAELSAQRDVVLTQRFLSLVNDGLRQNPLLNPIALQEIPEIAAAALLLAENKSCSSAVGGTQSAAVALGLPSIQFYRFSFPSSMQTKDGRSLAVFAITNASAKAVLLLDAYWAPDAARTLMLVDGSTQSTNLLRSTELAHSFKAGSLTPFKLRMLILLHELAHVFGAIPDDSGSLLQSMQNTKRVAFACAPELLAGEL